jgi:hypothetical protein
LIVFAADAVVLHVALTGVVCRDGQIGVALKVVEPAQVAYAAVDVGFGVEGVADAESLRVDSISCIARAFVPDFARIEIRFRLDDCRNSAASTSNFAASTISLSYSTEKSARGELVTPRLLRKHALSISFCTWAPSTSMTVVHVPSCASGRWSSLRISEAQLDRVVVNERAADLHRAAKSVKEARARLGGEQKPGERSESFHRTKN